MREIQFREALREAMSEEMRRDKSIFLMGEEVAEYNGAYKVSQGMLDEFGPERILDTPITELGFAGLGIGAAMNGLRPIIEIQLPRYFTCLEDNILYRLYFGEQQEMLVNWLPNILRILKTGMPIPRGLRLLFPLIPMMPKGC